MASTADPVLFEPNANPAPGNVAAFRALDRTFRDVADRASDVAYQLDMINCQPATSIWRGSAANVFATNIGELPTRLRKLATAYREAATGASQYAWKLEPLQASVSALKREYSAVYPTYEVHKTALMAPNPGQADTLAYNEADAKLRDLKRRTQEVRSQQRSAQTALVDTMSFAREQFHATGKWQINDNLKLLQKALTWAGYALLVAGIIAAVVCTGGSIIPFLIAGAGAVVGVMSGITTLLQKANGDPDAGWGEVLMAFVSAIPFAKTMKLVGPVMKHVEALQSLPGKVGTIAGKKLLGEANRLKTEALTVGTTLNAKVAPKLQKLQDLQKNISTTLNPLRNSRVGKFVEQKVTTAVTNVKTAQESGTINLQNGLRMAGDHLVDHFEGKLNEQGDNAVKDIANLYRDYWGDSFSPEDSSTFHRVLVG